MASTLIVLAGVWVMLAIIPGYEFTYGPYPSAFWPVVYVQGKGDVLRLFAIASVPIVLVVGILGGLVSYLVAGRVLKPLTDLTTLVRTIDERSLNTRLDLRGPADEIGTLAATFDTMLSRLETSFATNRASPRTLPTSSAPRWRQRRRFCTWPGARRRTIRWPLTLWHAWPP